MTPGGVQRTLPAPPAPAVKDPGEVAPPARRPAQIPADGKAITVRRFFITGNSLIADDELRAAVAEWENRALTLAEIHGVADRLTDLYHRRGYRLAMVAVPAQEVRGGIVRLEVIEGRIDSVVIEGNVRYSEAFLRRQIDPLAPGALATFPVLERELLLLNDLPGLIARSVLEPGERYGTTRVHLRVAERRIEGALTLDNHGSRTIGKERLGARIGVLNPGGRGDRADLALTHSEAGLLDFVEARYDMALGSDGNRLQFSASLADYAVGADFASLGLEGENQTFGVRFSRPWVRSRATNVLWTIGARAVDTELTAFGAPATGGSTDIALLDATIAWTRHHSASAASQLSAAYAGNFQSNDGTANDAQRARVTLEAQHGRGIGAGWGVAGRVQYTWSPDPLVDTEKVSLGGPASVRGYDNAEARGDRGGVVSVEVNRRIAIGPIAGRAYLFADAGQVSREQPLPGEPRDESLTAWGIGAQVGWRADLTLDAVWAQPADGGVPNDGRDGGRLWASVTLRF